MPEIFRPENISQQPIFDTDAENIKWNKSEKMLDRVSRSPFYEERINAESERVGYYQGRPIIHRDSPIEGGVYLGGGRREAIVVDNSKGQLNDVYQTLLHMRLSAQERGEHFKDGLLDDVWELVMQKLPYSMEVVEKLEKVFDLNNDKKISLNLYLSYGGGVCRHQALLGAYLLERLGKEGKVSGKVSVDRNSVDGRGHAWIRYTNHGGEVFILDPAQEYIGPLKDIDKTVRWFYERPEDLEPDGK